MTKKALIKEILTLGQELEKATGFDALMIIYDMESAIDKYVNENSK